MDLETFDGSSSVSEEEITTQLSSCSTAIPLYNLLAPLTLHDYKLRRLFLLAVPRLMRWEADLKEPLCSCPGSYGVLDTSSKLVPSRLVQPELFFWFQGFSLKLTTLNDGSISLGAVLSGPGAVCLSPFLASSPPSLPSPLKPLCDHWTGAL